MHLFLLALALIAGVSCPAAAASESGADLLHEGRADEAERLLHAQIAANPRDAMAHQLLCRVFYSEEHFNQAIHECETAASSDPGSSENRLWLGRAYGMKAAQANPLVAFSLARKVVAAFEHAVELDSANVGAMRDLGEYYVNAPGIVGGGLDKARSLAARMTGVSPAKAHRLLGQIAEKSGDYAGAEEEFKRAVEAQRSADSYVDLAQFYLNRKQFDRALSAVQAAVRLDRPRDPAAVDAAALLISISQSMPEDRMLPLAEDLLRGYLDSPAKSDDAPAFKVRLQLGNLLLQRGQPATAKDEYDAALALASGYAPARRAREQLDAQSAQKSSKANAIP